MAHPEFERVATGIDPYEHPQKTAVALIKKFELDLASPPITDEPIPKELRWKEGESSRFIDGHRVVRWGVGTTWRWDWGKKFTSFEQVLDFDPATIKVLPPNPKTSP